MRSCGSVQSKRGLKSPSGEENGDGSATLWESLPPTSPTCLLSRTFKESGGRVDLRSLGEGQSRRNMRTWGCNGMKWNGLQKIGSDGRLLWKPYTPVWEKRIKKKKKKKKNGLCFNTMLQHRFRKSPKKEIITFRSVSAVRPLEDNSL